MEFRRVRWQINRRFLNNPELDGAVRTLRAVSFFNLLAVKSVHALSF